MKEKIIINSAEAFPKIKKFLKKYFDNVEVVKNECSHLADRSQNFYKCIVFENRGTVFTIHWNYYNCKLYFGRITEVHEKTCLYYSFTKMKLDFAFPIEVGSNTNVVFWELDIISEHEDIPMEISPLRLPVTIKSKRN